MGVQFSPSSRRYLDSQPHNVRTKIINDVAWIKDNPHLRPDNPTIRPFLAPPSVMRLFQDDFHWILFYLDADNLMEANIGDIAELPHLFRRPR
jgi:hypothetical protein